MTARTAPDGGSRTRRQLALYRFELAGIGAVFRVGPLAALLARGCAALLLEVSYGPSGSYESLRALLLAHGFDEAATLNELEEGGLPIEADKLFVRRGGA